MTDWLFTQQFYQLNNEKWFIFVFVFLSLNIFLFLSFEIMDSCFFWIDVKEFFLRVYIFIFFASTVICVNLWRLVLFRFLRKKKRWSLIFMFKIHFFFLCVNKEIFRPRFIDFMLIVNINLLILYFGIHTHPFSSQKLCLCLKHESSKKF